MKINLESAKELINANTCITVEIREVYEDFGAGLKHRNLISVNDPYQVLCPRDVKRAEACELSIEAIQEIIEKINKRGW